MLRMRIPAGELTATQMDGLADVAEDWGGGSLDCTTRANLQIRQIRPAQHRQGAAAPAGTRPHRKGAGRGQRAQHHRHAHGRHRPGRTHRHPAARQGDAPLHPQQPRPVRAAAQVQHLLRRRRGDRARRRTPTTWVSSRCKWARRRRKRRAWSRAFTSGWNSAASRATSSSPRTWACSCARNRAWPWARRSCAPSTKPATAPTARKARLKYVVDRLGYDGFLALAEAKLDFKLARLPLDQCEPRPRAIPHGHIGVYRQRQPRPQLRGRRRAGRTHQRQADAAAGGAFAQLRHGRGPPDRLAKSHHPQRAGRLRGNAQTQPRAGWGSTTRRAASAADWWPAPGRPAANGRRRTPRSTRSNWRVTWRTAVRSTCRSTSISPAARTRARSITWATSACWAPRSARTRWRATTFTSGGGFGQDQGVGRELFRGVSFESLKPTVEKMLRGYLRHREKNENFQAFTRRHDMNTLQAIFSNDE